MAPSAGEITAPGIGASPAASSGDAGETDADKALGSATPLSGFTGGTLGFPGSGAPGVVAAFKLQAGGNAPTFDVLAQAGTLQLSRRFAIDIVGEQVKVDTPMAVFTPGAGRPLPKLQAGALTSAGLRFRYGKTTLDDDDRAAISSCLAAAALPGATAPTASATRAKDLVGGCEDLGRTEEDRVRTWTRAKENVAKSSITIGARFLYRSEDLSGNAAGVAAEATPELRFGGTSLFLSGVFLWLNKSRKEVDGIVTDAADLKEARGTVGVLQRFSWIVGGVQLAPRLGGYFTYSRNFWSDPFGAAGVDREISGRDVEGGIFAGGHFSGGFNGLFQFGIRKPYGPNSDLQYIVAVVPSIGTETGNTK